MSQNPVHFELFIRRKVNAPWTLELATEDRARAIAAAEEMLADNRAAAVKVTKELLNPDTREFSSVTLLAKGAVEARRPKKEADPANGPLCVSPQDLYSVHARERIGRLLEGWLRRKRVTPFELLHRPDLVEELDASGIEIQHAVQKIAIPEAQARGLSTHEVIRTFQALVDRAVERLIGDGRKKAFPTIDRTGFAEAVESMGDDPDRNYRLGGAVARFLADAPAWGDKVARVLDLADSAPQAGRARGVALQVLEQPLSEIVGVKDGLADLIGPDADLGQCLAAMARIAADAEIQMLERFDKTMGVHLPPLSGEAARLSAWLQRDAFEAVRVSLLRRIVLELKGPRRLRPASPEGEIDILRALAMALTACAPKLLSLDDVQEAFIERSKGLVGGDFVTAYLEGRESVAAEVRALIRLAENVAGPVNKRAASRWVVAAVGALRFEKELRDASVSPMARLHTLASLQRAVRKAAFDPADTELCLAKLGEIGAMVETDSRVLQSIARSEGPAANRLLALLKLANGEAGPTGLVAERARAEAFKMLRSPDIRVALAERPETLETIRSLMTTVGLAA